MKLFGTVLYNLVSDILSRITPRPLRILILKTALCFVKVKDLQDAVGGSNILGKLSKVCGPEKDCDEVKTVDNRAAAMARSIETGGIKSTDSICKQDKYFEKMRKQDDAEDIIKGW